MSPSAYITVRTTKSGKRYHVRYRPGGRYTKLVHAGAFKTRRDAETRRQFVIAELAAGRDPVATLRTLEHPSASRTVREDFRDWLASRVDLRASSARTYTAAFKALPAWLLDKASDAVTHLDVSRAFEEMKQAPKTKRTYKAALAQVFDYADIERNPVRDRRFRLPQAEREEVHPPAAEHVLAMLDRLPARQRLPFVVIEQTGARVEEVVSIGWGDVDVIGNRLRVTPARSKTHRARWLQVPEWLMTLVADICPPEDRTPARRVFPTTAASLRSAMRRACIAAGIPHYHPHDLRHRRISLWHGQGLTARELAHRAGHSATVSLDVYSHVIGPAELSPESLAESIVRSR